MKFTHNGTNYYISEHNKVGDDIDLLTKPIASTQSFITKYESLLESKKLSKEIKEDLGKAKWLPELKEKYLRKTSDI